MQGALFSVISQTGIRPLAGVAGDESGAAGRY